MIEEPATVATMTHGTAFALIMAFAALLGGMVFLFSRERRLYYQTVATLFILFSGVSWFGVKPEIEVAARHGTTPHYADKIAPAGAETKSIDKAGRFVRPPDGN